MPVREGQIRALSVHAATGRLALGTSLGLLSVWNVETTLPEHVLGTSNGPVRSLEFTADGRQLLSSSSEGMAVL